MLEVKFDKNDKDLETKKLVFRVPESFRYDVTANFDMDDNKMFIHHCRGVVFN